MAELGIDYYAIGRPHVELDGAGSESNPAWQATPPIPVVPRARISAARVLVVGDVMLDRYWFGDVNRISPEAPVPVVHVQRKEDRLGGAANVARNAAALGAQAGLLCVVGHDEPGERIVELLGESKVAAHLERDPELLTTIKLRVLSRQQQLLRVDFENSPTHEVLHACLARFADLLPQHDVILMSDYAKGGLTHVTQMIADAQRAGKPVLVDPKGDDWDRYRGATLITPNRAELREVVGQWKSEEDLRERVAKLRAELRVRRAAADAFGGGHDAVHRQPRAAHAGRRARSVRRVRRGRHRHRDGRGDARRGRAADRRDRLCQPGGRASSSANWARRPVDYNELFA